MTIGYLAIISLLMLSSCSTKQSPITQQPIEHGVQFLQPARRASITCLDKNLKFLEHKPKVTKEFVADIAKASVSCMPSEDDITEYVKEIIDRHGHNL